MGLVAILAVLPHLLRYGRLMVRFTEMQQTPHIVLAPPYFWVDDGGKGHLGALRGPDQSSGHVVYNLRPADLTVGYADMVGGSNARMVPHAYIFSVGEAAVIASATMGIRLKEPRAVRWGRAATNLLVVYDRNTGPDDLLELHKKWLDDLSPQRLEDLHTNRIGGLFDELIKYAPDTKRLPPEVENLPQ